MRPDDQARGYVICSEHRSGSTFLCELLSSTGVLGYPDEFFRDPMFDLQLERDPALLQDILQRASTPNKVFGIKVFSNQFDITSRLRWAELPGLTFIHLERRDLLGQAISYVKALQTGRYLPGETARGKPNYDRKAIDRHLRRMSDGQLRWRRYFARNGIDPLWLVYEEMIADPEAALAAVADRMGVNVPKKLDTSAVNLVPLRDEISEAWRIRFIEESRDLNYLDMRLGRSRVWLRRLARNCRYSYQLAAKAHR